MGRAILSPPNAILFVLDPTNNDTIIPSYTDGELTAATNTCISVGTQADVDGDTEVSLETTSVAPSGLQRIFRGVISVPGGTVAVVTSQFQRVLEANVRASAVEISVWADDLRNPARVAVGVRPVDPPASA